VGTRRGWRSARTQQVRAGVVLGERIHAELIEHCPGTLLGLLGASSEAARENSGDVGRHRQHVDEAVWLLAAPVRADEEELAAGSVGRIPTGATRSRDVSDLDRPVGQLSMTLLPTAVVRGSVACWLGSASAPHSRLDAEGARWRYGAAPARHHGAAARLVNEIAPSRTAKEPAPAGSRSRRRLTVDSGRRARHRRSPSLPRRAGARGVRTAEDRVHRARLRGHRVDPRLRLSAGDESADRRGPRRRRRRDRADRHPQQRRDAGEDDGPAGGVHRRDRGPPCWPR
jgi:hypothetical protein